MRFVRGKRGNLLRRLMEGNVMDGKGHEGGN